MTTAARRVMLVELIPDQPERVNRSQAYPSLMGLGRRMGWKTWWRTLGVRYDPTVRYTLEPGDLDALLADVRRHKPEVLVINERLRDGQQAALAAAGAPARIVYCTLERAEDFAAFASFVRRNIQNTRSSVLDDPRLLDTIAPVFRRKSLNRAPWLAQPFIRVVAGVYCAYRTRAADNPHYRGLKLPSPFMSCSFCASGPAAKPRKPPLENPLAFVVRQVEAACRRRGAAGGAIRFELSGSETWHRLETLVGTLARRGVRAAEFHFMPRVDELLAARKAVVRSMPLLVDGGMALRLYGMSVENFSPAENLRFNKGITAEQVHEAVAFMNAVHRRWPAQFHPPPGGLSMILFTPWTTLEDLRINVENIERCPMIDRSFALSRRLQLFPGRPITALAKRDGLIAAKRDDHFYNAGCMTAADQDDFPWRFRRPEVAVLWRLARRLSCDRERLPDDDPEKRALASFLAGASHNPADPLPVFRRALETVERDPRIDSVFSLLDRMRA